MTLQTSIQDYFNPQRIWRHLQWTKAINYYSWLSVQLVQVCSYQVQFFCCHWTSTMDSDKHKCIYGDPEKVVQYMDYSENPIKDNSRYIPDLVPGMLQPLEVIKDDPQLDKILSTLDVEAIVQESEAITKDVDNQIQKQLSHFPDPCNKEIVEDYSKHKFAPSTRKKSIVGEQNFWAVEVHQKFQTEEGCQARQLDYWKSFSECVRIEWHPFCVYHGNSQTKWPGISKGNIVWNHSVHTTLHGNEWTWTETSWSCWTCENEEYTG